MMPNIAPDNLPDRKIERLEQALEACQQENERMFWLLDEARQCLRSVDKKEVFGFGQDGRTRWLLVDELLSKIDAALKEQEMTDERTQR